MNYYATYYEKMPSSILESSAEKTAPKFIPITLEQFVAYGGVPRNTSPIVGKVDTTPSTTELASSVTVLQAQVKAQTESNTFLEDCIAEMAMQVYK